MENILIGFVIIIGIIVCTSILNEKKLHMQQEIAFVLIAFLVSIVFMVIQKIGINLNFEIGKNLIDSFQFNKFLLNGILCFMLFASASKINLNKMTKNILPIASLSLLATIVSSSVYALFFYGINLIFNFGIGIWECLLMGCIISPTDPIAITGILNKLGISKSLLSVIEGESLFNDGVGVALFVFVSKIIKNNVIDNFLLLMLKELFGAIAVGLIISCILFKLVKKTNQPMVHILISLLTVSLSYVICEKLEFSGVIASVVCGMYFAYKNKKIARWKEVVDAKDLYNDFWNIVETVLNSILFVIVGFSVIKMDFTNKNMILMIPIAILLNLVTRAIGVAISTSIIGKNKLPDKYKFKEFVYLMTLTGLKGGLSLALVMNSKELLSLSTYNILLNVTMITILFTTIIEGSLIKKIYKLIESKKEEKALIKI